MKALLASLALLPALAIADTSGPKVTLAGIQVVHDSAAEDFDGFKTFNKDPGLQVALVVRSTEKSLVGFDDEKAEMTIGGAAAETQFFGRMRFSEDRSAMRVTFSAKSAVEANHEGLLEVKGVLPLVLATGTEDVRSAPFRVEVGETIDFPEDIEDLPALKVNKAGEPSWGDGALEIEFGTNQRMSQFAAVRFLTADGTEVESSESGQSWTRFGSRASGTASYRIADNHDELILVLKRWTGREELDLDVDLKAGWRPPDGGE